MVEKFFFSFFARLIRSFRPTKGRKPGKEELKEKIEEKKQEGVPSPIDIQRREKEKETLQPVEKVPRPPAKKRKKIKQPSQPKTDKKGFAVLTDKHDLYQLFAGEKRRKKKPGEEDFAEMFEKSQTDKYQLLLLKEKKSSIDKTTPLTVGERIKEYPLPQVELDLHGYTAANAEAAAETFIRNARQKGVRTVRIIVGKGLHSNGKAVLPDVIEKKILQLKRNQWVLGFKWEKKDKLKSGALVAYLL